MFWLSYKSFSILSDVFGQKKKVLFPAKTAVTLPCLNDYLRNQSDNETRCLWEHCVKTWIKSGKCSSLNVVCQGKITSVQPNYNDKVYFVFEEKSLKDSPTTPNPLLIKIAQTTQNCQENTGKLNGATLCQSNMEHHKKMFIIWFKGTLMQILKSPYMFVFI